MSQSIHYPGILSVNLEYLAHNLNYFRSKLNEGVKTMAMLKAFGYGNGAEQVAKFLETKGINYFGVASIEEGVKLRESGINTPIMIQNPATESVSDLVKYRLEPSVFSLGRIKDLAVQVKLLRGDKHFKIHLKLESGMNRLGFNDSDLAELISVLKSSEKLSVESVFSHLAASDDESERAFSLAQIEKFQEMSAYLKAELKIDFWRHMCNSNGVLAYPQAHFDLVRIGMGLYGIVADPRHQKNLKPTTTLKAFVTQIKTLKKGESTSYGRKFIAEKPTKIAIISMGYEDGFRRVLGHGNAQVFIKGKYYPTIGTICMDMFMVNITNSQIEEGDAVEIFGEHIPVQEIAKKLNTISYEIFTSVSQRVRRVYHKS